MSLLNSDSTYNEECLNLVILQREDLQSIKISLRMSRLSYAAPYRNRRFDAMLVALGGWRRIAVDGHGKLTKRNAKSPAPAVTANLLCLNITHDSEELTLKLARPEGPSCCTLQVL